MTARIWPERVVQIKLGHNMVGRRSELSGEEVEQILELAANAGPASESVLHKPIELGGDEGTMISLTVAGEDGFMSGVLLLRITIEYRGANTYVRLAIVPQVDQRERDAFGRKAMLPGEAADLLDKLAAQLQSIFVLERSGYRYPLPH